MKHLTIHKIFTALMLTAALGSCSKGFLDTTPQQSTDLNNVVVDLPSTRGAINGIYSLMKSADYYGRTMFVNADLMADNAYISKKIPDVTCPMINTVSPATTAACAPPGTSSTC